MVAVRLTPGASPDAIVGARGAELAVRVSAPPLEGKANQCLRKLIAKACGVPAGRVEIVRGARARQRLLRIDGLRADEAARMLARADD